MGLLDGIFGGGNGGSIGGKQSATTTETNMTDSRRSFGNGAIVNEGNGAMNVNLTDGGAFSLVDSVVSNVLHDTTGVTTTALQQMSALAAGSQKAAVDTVTESYGLLDSVIKNVTGHADAMLTQSINTLAGQMQAAYQEGKGNGANWDKIVMLAIAAAAAVMVFGMRK